MSDFNIATGEHQPLNRTGIANVQLTGEKQGTPVGIDTSGTDPKLVPADAAPDANEANSGPVPAIGVLMEREVLPDGKYGGVNTPHPWDDVEAQVYAEEGRTREGDRVTVIRYGIEMVDDDSDAGFTPGEPVYLAEGGGFTQTAPTTGGAAVQVLGVSVTQVENSLDPNNAGKDRFFLDVSIDYDTV